MQIINKHDNLGMIHEIIDLYTCLGVDLQAWLCLFLHTIRDKDSLRKRQILKLLILMTTVGIEL